MPETAAEILAKARALLREDKVQEADDLLTKGIAAAGAVAAPVLETPAPPPTRFPEAILLDILEVIHGLLGTPQPLETLLAELRAATPRAVKG